MTAKTLRPFQNDGVKFIENVAGRGIVGDDMGLGKAQPLYSLIKIPDGWKQMGNMKVGDAVSTPDGKIANVVDVFPQGLRPVYRITFRDGRFEDCDENHLWKVYESGWSWKHKNGQSYKVGDPWKILGKKVAKSQSTAITCT